MVNKMLAESKIKLIKPPDCQRQSCEIALTTANQVSLQTYHWYLHICPANSRNTMETIGPDNQQEIIRTLPVRSRAKRVVRSPKVA